MSYFSKETLNNLRLQQGMSAHRRQRSLDITLACKLTLTYVKYHLMMDYRQLAMSMHQMTYQEAERQAEMMNQITIVHHSAADFLDTPDDRVNDSIDTYRAYKRLLEEYSDEVFVLAVVEEFCKRVYEDDEHFIFFKPFCNLYYSVYADALLWYQQGRIDYYTFCIEFQELSWMDGSRTPLDGKRLKMYIMSMREVVDFYKQQMNK
ncbi:hypothetical protein [Prevotella sp. E13-27]|uniref:hypothetical protein n=1 Tax=Prevotella sp. E13-27 TaxID=2938122 RepID=UPI00200B00C6|nr:hypothetical protein [Prevotella sp. E13-27]MCK8621736.1 hypothetical protein [Prevotella sp. E13-27]